ncbi:MAG: hypothetical protein KC457_06775, partial [Myxococcales bacterium]|nr:hypothetical protein [Myxococcales bacterium]
MRPILRLAPVLVLFCACNKPASTTTAPVTDPSAGEVAEEASGPAARWRYTIAVDEALEHLDLGLCIVGPQPQRLVATEGALAYVEAARVRGGPELVREDGGLRVDDLGEQGCVDLRIDLGAAVADGGRDVVARSGSLMISPRSWLWHPARIPQDLDAQARFELPAGLHATVPWPEVDAGADGGEQTDWRRLSSSAFRWDAWASFGRSPPLHFVAAECPFEVAVLGGTEAVALDEAALQRWITVAAETSATLYGRFPRERVTVVVVPASGWRDDPVLFGMARRGGGASAMLMLDTDASAEALVGEWVAAHEFLHLTMPYIADPWMSEGFVTYYTQILRARRGVLGWGGASEQGESAEQRQARLA